MAIKTVRSVRGFVDVLPEEARKWRMIEVVAREVFELHGFEEIRTPILEKTELFTRSVGEATDIVGKEMYTFLDRGGESLSLRPEGTAPVVRAYLEHGLSVNRPESRLFYLGPMFRHERPQHGRLRQFHQIGGEIFGTASPEADAEIISLQIDLLSRLGLKDFFLLLNSLGCRDCQPRYRAALLNYLEPLASKLCSDCQRRIGSNPLRILDCREAGCRAQLEPAPRIPEFLCTDCHDHFAELQNLLEAMELRFELDPYLVRGLDYYTRTTFEIFPPRSGNRSRPDAISAGGRYDELIADLGGPRIPAVGFALGIERILLQSEIIPPPGKTWLALLGLGRPARRYIFKLARELRKNQLPARADLKGGSLKAQLHRADRNGAGWAIIVGENELQDESVLLRDLKASTQEKIPAREIISCLTEKLKKL